jgi:hypothetical protein
MADKITYFAVVDEDTSVDRPHGLVRRLDFDDDGFADEGLRRDFSWSFTPIVAEWKRGNFDDELVEVSHAQASKIIEYFREQWGPFGQPLGS